MQLAIEDIKICKLPSGRACDGKKHFDGYHEQLKQATLDALTSQTNWWNARSKIHDDVKNMIGKSMTSSYYDYEKAWNDSIAHPDYTLCIKVKDILQIVFTPSTTF